MKEGLDPIAGVECYSVDRWEARVLTRHLVSSNLAETKAKDYRPISLRNCELKSDQHFMRFTMMGPV